TSKFWSQHQNELIRRVCDLFPDSFAPVCQLPQTPGEPIDEAVRELERCVLEMGFVGCNINPDPSGGRWDGPPLWDSFWSPLWEKMCELDVPAMIHVSASTNENLQTTASHYLGADTTVFVQLLTSGFASRFPGLRLIIPHGGGAVPYHWGRFVGMAADQGWDIDAIFDHVFFDTCVYHQKGIDLLLDVIPAENILFGSEMIGAVRSVDADTGRYFDDTRFYVDNADVDDHVRDLVYSGNALRVFPRLELPA
ncbi:MAG: amidohydrolase family protein, partial [Acidimicrobiia bacterium]